MLIHRCRFVDFTPHSITALAFNYPSARESSPADLRLAVGRGNGDIEIWNPKYNWVHETTLKGGKDRSVEGLAWTVQDGEHRLFSTGGATSITEWDLATGLPLANHECNSGVIWAISVSPDGNKIAAGCENGSVAVLDISGGQGVAEHFKVMQRQSSRVMSLTWLNEDQLVGGCSDGKLRVWSISASGRIVATMKVDKSRSEETLVWSVAALHGGKQLVSGDSTGSVKFWDGVNFSLSKSFKVHEADVLCLAADFESQQVFSAGVDRKIVCYKQVGQSAERKKWVNASSRLLHSHDIRSLALYQSKDADFLVSGGVERTLVITAVNNFEGGNFRKIHITRQKPCVIGVPESRYVALWSDQSVKIWELEQTAVGEADSPGKHLVSKITLNTEEHVTHASISHDGAVLAVSTLAQIKVFDLSPGQNSLKVSKREVSAFKTQGASILRFIPGSNNLLTFVGLEQEVVLYDLAKDAVVSSVDLPAVDKLSSKLAHLSSISHITVTSELILATARPCGVVDLFDLKNGVHLQSLVNLRTPVTAIGFTLKGALVVVTADNKLLEFDTSEGGLTEWSRRNSDILPREFTSQQDKCCGIFSETSSPDRVWLWGANWLAFFDLSVNIPIQRVAKRKLHQVDGKDREARASSISSASSGIASPVSPSVGRQPFWITQKYRPMIFAASLGAGEIVVSERPTSSLPLPPAFWSNHKIAL